MNILKVKDGLLEAENFFLASSFSNFAGSANISRDIKKGLVYLNSNDKLERKFNYQQCVIEVKKQKSNKLNNDDNEIMYVGTNTAIYGIKDDKNGESNYWKICVDDGYVQVYSSHNGYDWTNLSGKKIYGLLTRQGFKKEHTNPLIIEKYSIYSSPYITLYNMPSETKVQFFNEKNIKLEESAFNEDMEAKIWLNYNIKGYFRFSDITNKEIFTTKLMDLKYGDIYMMSKYDLQVIYKNKVVDQDKYSLLNDLCESIIIKNNDNKTYKKIFVGIDTKSDDLIELSFDGVNFKDSLTIEQLQPNEGKEVVIRITRNNRKSNLNIRDFNLIFEVGDIIE